MEAIRELEQMMEDEYDYASMRKESVDLKLSLEAWMTDQNEQKLELDNYRWQLIKPESKRWNADKLRAVLGKAMFLKVCKVEPDPAKIDDLVRQGKIKLPDIEKALEFEPKKPYIKRYDNSDAKGDTEASKLKAAMDG
jgi:hypothetical protein